MPLRPPIGKGGAGSPPQYGGAGVSGSAASGRAVPILGQPSQAGRLLYRPQFVFPLAEGEEEFRYFFDQSNTPGLASVVPIAPGAMAPDITLPLQPDAPFLLRAVAIVAPPTFTPRLKDPDGNFLVDGFIQEWDVFVPSGILIAGFQPIVMEPEIPCARGSVFLLYLQNTSAAPATVGGTEVLLLGVKQFAEVSNG
jgi:hypothetical protein